MSDMDSARQRFGSFVEVAAIDRPFISRAEERRLLEQGLSRFNLTMDEARGVLLSVAQVRDIRVQRDLDRRMLPVLTRFGGRRRKISRKKFLEATAIYRDLAGPSLAEEEVKLCLKRIMEENGFRPRRSGVFFSRRWYDRIGKGKRGSIEQVAAPNSSVQA